MTLTWHVESSVPVFGGTVERLFADEVRDAVQAPHAYRLKYLTGVAPNRPRA